jgi:hypothetical protein
MRYATEAAFRAALEARFLKLAGPNNDKQLVRFRKMVAYERFLARLNVVAPNQWVVKGGLALEFRFGDRSRTTLDLDLSTPSHLSTIGEYILDAGRLDLGDYFQYVVDRSKQLDLQDEADVTRYRVTVLLDRRRFEQLVIDVGSGNLPTDVETIATANLLEFAGFEPLVVPALPLEIHIAEKLHAYTRPYGEGRRNTRVKDLIDLVLIPSLSSFELPHLRSAIDRSFDGRGTQLLPSRLPEPGEHWRIPYAELAREVGLPEDLHDGFAAAAEFLDPVLRSPGEELLTWEPEQWTWSMVTGR